MHFLKLLALCAGAALANPVPAARDDVPAASDVKIVSVVWNGSGCHMGGTAGATSPADTDFVLSGDRRTLTIIYSKYVAQSDIRGQPDVPRTNCLINIEVSYPKDWRYSISQTTFHGYC
jgi:Domain of unknown function (DUF4360)